MIKYGTSSAVISVLFSFFENRTEKSDEKRGNGVLSSHQGVKSSALVLYMSVVKTLKRAIFFVYQIRKTLPSTCGGSLGKLLDKLVSSTPGVVGGLPNTRRGQTTAIIDLKEPI